MDKILFSLVFFYYLYMVGILYYLFMKRKSALHAGEVKMSYFKDYKTGGTTELVVIQNHFNNQFQMPIFFFITAVVAKLFNAVNELTLILAFVFVLTRFWHSYIHLTFNKPLYRSLSFFIGLIILMVMWVNILVVG